jgi:GcrA cell cycle regulator
MWTEQTIGDLRKFALEGRSAAWIASAIGAPSRNAVIGKARRLGVKLKGTRGESGEKESEAAPAPRKAATPHVRVRAPSARREDAPPRRRFFAEPEPSDFRRIGLTEIGEAECRWPLGEPSQDDFAYCGNPAARGQTYCAVHCRMAYHSLRYARISA